MVTAEVGTDPHVHESPQEHVLVSFEQVQSAHLSQGKCGLEGEAIGGCREIFKLIMMAGVDGWVKEWMDGELLWGLRRQRMNIYSVNAIPFHKWFNELGEIRLYNITDIIIT